MKKRIILNYIDIMMTIIIIVIGVFLFYSFSYRANSFLLQNFFFPLISVFLTFFLGINTGNKIAKAREGHPVGFFSKMGARKLESFDLQEDEEESIVITTYEDLKKDLAKKQKAKASSEPLTKEEIDKMKIKTKILGKKVKRKRNLFEEKEKDDFKEDIVFKDTRKEEDIFDDIMYEEKVFDSKPPLKEQPKEKVVEEVVYAKEEDFIEPVVEKPLLEKEVQLEEDYLMEEEIIQKITEENGYHEIEEYEEYEEDDDENEEKDNLPVEFTINKDDYF